MVRGSMQSVELPAPAAGYDATWVLSGEQPARLHSLIAVFTTSAAVATRVPALILADPNGNTVYAAGVAGGQAASLAQAYILSPALGTATGGHDGVVPAVLLSWPDVWVPAGWSIATRTLDIQAGDTWGAGRALVQFGMPVTNIERRDADVVDLLARMAGGA